jgi:small RNA 2'-O-methyltransferase
VTRSGRRERRRAAEARRSLPEWGISVEVRGQGVEVSPLHDARVEAVATLLVNSGARSVLDLGCGSGALIRRLLKEDRQIRTVGIEQSASALTRASELIALEHPGAERGTTLIHGSFMDSDEDLAGFDAAALVETIEHIDPARLSEVERTVFGLFRPTMVIVTTPNREYNVRYGMPDGCLRHSDHRFEWSRSRFRQWADGVSKRTGYTVAYHDVGPVDALHGSPTQLAAFTRISP